ncbi:MAG: hypothetical protein COB66_01745 [Coxiella sp. (in: Bacteria)]|nr:MAG: hypothetical protein COB66_01745 [Coxiella sp. (in: g-proteobacteria)]
MGRHHRQKASALLTALFITAICAIIATAVIYKFRLLVHLAALNNFSNQSYLYLNGVQDQAESDLARYYTNWQTPTANSLLTMPRNIGPQKFENVRLYAHVIDAEGLFNINMLASTNNQSRFINLLHSVAPNLSQQKALQLTQHITDWLSLSNTGDQIYARLHPPYRAGHQPMLDLSELRMVAGMTPTIFNAIKPYLTAIPAAEGQTTPININTASPGVLLTLSSAMDITKAQALYACRQGHGVFLSVADYNKTCVQPLGISSLKDITTHSNYFIVDSTATTRHQQVTLKSMLSTVQNSKTKATESYVVWQMSG